MQIGILYICTGKYSIFWKSFYESAEKYFLTNHKKIYYVFTDAKKIAYKENKNVIVIFQENLGWPYNTLMRFHIFNKNKKILSKTDYLFFFNANMLFVSSVEEEIIPYNEGLMALQQPGIWNKPREKFPYESNTESTAYIPPEKGKYYVMGALNGGKTEKFLIMSKILAENIDRDIKNEIIAIWHDESHLNWYLSDKEFKLLNPSYGYPDNWELPFKPKIYLRDKNRFGGHDKLRGIKITKSKNEILFKKIYFLKKNMAKFKAYSLKIINNFIKKYDNC